MKTNVLYFGDNLEVLRDRIPDESIDFTYIDPPFNSWRNFVMIFQNRAVRLSRRRIVVRHVS